LCVLPDGACLRRGGVDPTGPPSCASCQCQTRMGLTVTCAGTDWARTGTLSGASCPMGLNVLASDQRGCRGAAGSMGRCRRRIGDLWGRLSPMLHTVGECLMVCRRLSFPLGAAELICSFFKVSTVSGVIPTNKSRSSSTSSWYPLPLHFVHLALHNILMSFGYALPAGPDSTSLLLSGSHVVAQSQWQFSPCCIRTSPEGKAGRSGLYRPQSCWWAARTVSAHGGQQTSTCVASIVSRLEPFLDDVGSPPSSC
jgi:hypothetical protein